MVCIYICIDMILSIWHITMKIPSWGVRRAKIGGIQETIACRIFLFRWPFGPLHGGSWALVTTYNWASV